LQKINQMKKISFNECTLEFMDDNLGTKRVFDSGGLKTWATLAQSMTITDHDIIFIDVIRGLLRKNAATWHEQDLALHFIGPLFSLINFTEPYRFNLFAERYISSTINDIELSGKPDELIATGFAEPKIPFFAFQAGGVPQYKREKDPNGDPAGQVLAAMMAGQALNQNDWPIYGCYVIGQNRSGGLLVFYCTSRSFL
jgi:hypothetical protein